MSKQITTTKISFPEIQLQTRDAHKLRGYFGDYFREHSPLLHNHYQDGSSIYKYPLVQYKVIDHVPILVGINEGSELLTQLFLKISELNINGKVYPVHSKNIEQKKSPVGIAGELVSYQFVNYWMALNSSNYKEYSTLSPDQKKIKLNQLLTNNILSFCKGIGIWLEDRVMVKGEFNERKSKLKDNTMIVFEGGFIGNIWLPGLVGLGKSVSRGFGTIRKN